MFPASDSFLTLALSTCDEASPEIQVLVKKLAIRQIWHNSELRSNESRLLAEGNKITRLRRGVSSIINRVLSFHTRYHLCRQRLMLIGARSSGRKTHHLCKYIVPREAPGLRGGKEGTRTKDGNGDRDGDGDGSECRKRDIGGDGNQGRSENEEGARGERELGKPL